MKILDYCSLKIKAGNGGNGSNSKIKIKRKKTLFTGGSGGNGGNVLIEYVNNRTFLHDLFSLRERVIKADNGNDGSVKCKDGKNGKDLILSLPFFTDIFDEQENCVLKFSEFNTDKKHILLYGAKGGKGSSHFNRLASVKEISGEISPVNKFSFNIFLKPHISIYCKNILSFDLCTKLFYKICNTYQNVQNNCTAEDVFIGEIVSKDFSKKEMVMFFPKFDNDRHNKYVENSDFNIFIENALHSKIKNILNIIEQSLKSNIKTINI